MKNVCLLLALTIFAFAARSDAKPFLFSYSVSLNCSDSTIAENYMSKGDSLFNEGQYDSAIVYFEKAAVIYERMEDWENYIYCLSEKGKSFHRNGEFSTALKIFQDTKTLILEKFGEKHISMVRISSYLGATYHRMGDYKRARRYSNEAIILAKNFENVKDLKTITLISSNYNSLGILDFEEGKYDNALINFQQALDISEEYIDKAPLMVGNSHNSLAIVYSEKGYNDEAIFHYEKALIFYSKNVFENQWQVALTYQNMAILMSESNGDYDEALVYVEKALPILLEICGETHYHVAMSYYNKGNFLFKKGNFDNALIFYNKALNTYKSVLKTEEHTDVAMTYNSIGEVYESKADYEKALEYYQNSLSIRLSIFSEQHADVAKSYNNIGSINRTQKKYEESIKYHENALNILKQTYGNYHPEIAECYNLLGLVYKEQNKMDISLQHFQNSLKANVPSFSSNDIKSNPGLEEIISEPVLLESLGYKAETLSLWYDAEKSDISILIAAFDTYTTMVDLIDKMRSGHKAEGSKLFLAEKSSEIFEKAIEISIQLHGLTGNIKYKDAAHLFCERSKARILQEAINESQARNFSGIPDNLLGKERQLKIDLTFYENQLQDEKYRKDNIDSLKIKNMENRLFSLNREYQQLVKELEVNFPKYYSSKYSNKPIDVHEVQKSLENGEALLEYFIGSEAIYLYYFSKNNYDLITIDINPRFDELVTTFYSSIKKIEKKEYLKSANQLYDILVKPVEHLLTGKQKLIIIPDGELFYVPFEALIAQVNPQDNKDFSELNYLINFYDISYNYSTSFLTSTPGDSFGNINDNGLIGFAPVFKNSPAADLQITKNVRSLENLDSENNEYRFLSGKDKIRELPYSEEELKSIIDLFEDKKKPASGYFNEEASKQNFKSEAGKYQFVHLATHSFVNPEKPQFSGIILSQPENSAISSTTIYSNEIYNLQLNADLVVLSSCESGIGKLIKGEGMMALTRGFLYAGANNIITSLWKVLDKSTSELMQDFYKNTLNNMSYSQSLRAAKLEMINNKSTSFPINWSGFILIGR